MDFFALCESHPLPMWVLDGDSLGFIAVNAASVENYGFAREDYPEMSVGRICPGLDPRILRDGGTIRARVRTQGGGELGADLHASAAYLNERSTILVVVHHLSELETSDLRARELETIIDAAQVVIVLCDPDGRIRLWNQRAAGLYGWTAEESLGLQATGLYQSGCGDIAGAHQAVREHGAWNGDLKLTTKTGLSVDVNSRWTAILDDRGLLRGILMVDTDLGNQKAIEEHALRSQRLESIGTLASGIAHDLNNILTPILMSVGILRTRPIDSESMKLINAIEGSAERGAGIVRQVLTFARGVAGDRMILQPRHLVNELIKILSQSFPKNIAVRTQTPKDLWMVSGDATQIHQVLLNLCVNARDAMPEGGSMLLVADNVVLDAAVQEAAPEAKPGAYVMLQVTDTGSGIAPEIIKRMYDPFFTTKEVGKGTGLGLSTARGIVKNHGGFMLAESAVGQGTTFKVFFPASLTGESPLKKGNAPEIPRGNGELILVVDDEAPVRAAATRTLEGHGYQVYTAEDGADALALYFQRRSQIQLVLTDYTMEQMDGMQLAQALKRLDPHVRIIVSSGQCGEDKVAAFRARGVNAFLDKPYKPEAMLQMIYEELQRE